jgi:hypothetical protein
MRADVNPISINRRIRQIRRSGIVYLLPVIKTRVPDFPQMSPRWG